MGLGSAIGLFVLATVVIVLSGVRMTAVADRLADQTRLGEAVVGGLLLGMSTSLPGVVTSITAALDGNASLAVSNSIGGIAIQTVFLVIADMSYRKANLEHAAADERNMLQAALLVLLLALPLAAYLAPPLSVWGIHPVSVALFICYFLGARSTITLHENPSWRPKRTHHTREDEPDEAPGQRGDLTGLGLRFAVLAALLGGSGYLVAQTGTVIARELDISQTVVGALLTATATSLPELVTTMAAVRRGALQLAVAGIVGGNTFDVLFLALSDIAFRDGSLYHAMLSRDALLLAGGVIITAILLMGLILRDRRGIGFEGVSIITLYALMIAVQFALG